MSEDVRCANCGTAYRSPEGFPGLLDFRLPRRRTSADLDQEAIWNRAAGEGMPSTPVDGLDCRNDFKSLLFREVSDRIGWPGEGSWTIDLGCFDGSLSRNWTLRYGTSIAGIDASPEAISRARRADPFDNVYHLASLEALPFPDSSFDAALCLDVLEHVEDPFPVLEEAARVLRPGAPYLFYVVSSRLTGTWDWWSYYVRRVFGRNVPARLGDCPEGGHDADRLVDPRAFRSLLRAAGFTVVELRPFHSFFTTLYDDRIRPALINWRARRGKAEPPPSAPGNKGAQAIVQPSAISPGKHGRLAWVDRARRVAETLDLPWRIFLSSRGFLVHGRRAA